MRAEEVFVPGGYPRHTYNPRADLRLEQQLRDYLRERHKLLTITGMTKAGKTVLAETVLPPSAAMWIPGGSIDSDADFWDFVVARLGLHTGYEDQRSTSQHNTVQGGVGSQIGMPGIASAQGTVSGASTSATGNSVTYRHSASSKVTAIEGLRRAMRPVVVDDFHHIDKEVQAKIVRNLKALVFDGLPVVLLAVPHRRFDAVRVEGEMTGRVAHIKIGAWSDSELEEIPRKGFPLLKLNVSDGVVRRLVPECFGSPHLMQEFCLRLCRSAGVAETLATVRDVTEPPDWRMFFHVAAEDVSKATFDLLAKGPERTTRIGRTLKDGRQVDIYQAVLLALAHVGARPEMTWETIRGGLREIMGSDIPQAHEVTRVLEQMTEIARRDQNVRPVMEWGEPGKLYIYDPFFSFYLKWGIDQPA